MVLRHKKKQISFLHVFHHFTIVLIADYGYHHAPWPAIIPIGSLNSFVHIVMYGYYGLTAFYPLTEFQFKRRITQLQMTQFLLAALQGYWGFLHYNFCVYYFLYPLGLFGLFSNYYYQAFLRKKSTKSADKKE